MHPPAGAEEYFESHPQPPSQSSTTPHLPLHNESANVLRIRCYIGANMSWSSRQGLDPHFSPYAPQVVPIKVSVQTSVMASVVVMTIVRQRQTSP